MPYSNAVPTVSIANARRFCRPRRVQNNKAESKVNLIKTNRAPSNTDFKRFVQSKRDKESFIRFFFFLLGCLYNFFFFLFTAGDRVNYDFKVSVNGDDDELDDGRDSIVNSSKDVVRKLISHIPVIMVTLGDKGLLVRIPITTTGSNVHGLRNYSAHGVAGGNVKRQLRVEKKKLKTFVIKIMKIISKHCVCVCLFLFRDSWLRDNPMTRFRWYTILRTRLRRRPSVFLEPVTGTYTRDKLLHES